MQEVILDKHVKLLDSPGIVMASGSTDAQIILRNCVKVSLSRNIVLCVFFSLLCYFIMKFFLRCLCLLEFDVLINGI